MTAFRRIWSIHPSPHTSELPKNNLQPKSVHTTSLLMTSKGFPYHQEIKPKSLHSIIPTRPGSLLPLRHHLLPSSTPTAALYSHMSLSRSSNIKYNPTLRHCPCYSFCWGHSTSDINLSLLNSSLWSIVKLLEMPSQTITYKITTSVYSSTTSPHFTFLHSTYYTLTRWIFAYFVLCFLH